MCSFISAVPLEMGNHSKFSEANIHEVVVSLLPFKNFVNDKGGMWNYVCLKLYIIVRHLYHNFSLLSLHPIYHDVSSTASIILFKCTKCFTASNITLCFFYIFRIRFFSFVGKLQSTYDSLHYLVYVSISNYVKIFKIFL